MPKTDESEITALLDLSARLGRDPLLAQGSSGNTSVKLDGVLWIKASGKWLAHAAGDEILVPVDLAEAKYRMARNTDFSSQYRTPSGNRLKSSIETAMHAVLPHRVVVHVHSVNTIAWAVRKDGPVQLAARLAGLDWQWIPYVPSGLPLAREIEQTLSEPPDSNVFVLANHGLVIGAQSCDAAATLLEEVENCLAIDPRRAPEPDCALLADITDGTEWDLPSCPAIHSLGTDPVSRRILRGGVLYPCQAIFLAIEAPIMPQSAFFPEAVNRYEREHGIRPPFFLVEGAGVVVNRNITGAEYATLAGLAEVARRIDASAPIRYLVEAEVMALLAADVYGYRALAGRAEWTGSRDTASVK